MPSGRQAQHDKHNSTPFCHPGRKRRILYYIMNYNFFVYILTNIHRQVLYTGVTNDLSRRIYEHTEDANEQKKTFAGKYNCIYLVYWERFQYIDAAIGREKEIKGWKREKKYNLIRSMNPAIKFLNDELE